MAYSIVQGGGGQPGYQASGTSPVTATLAVNPTPGNLVLCSVLATSAQAPTSVQDANGHQYILINSGTNTTLFGGYLYILVVKNSPNAAVTVTLASKTLHVTLYELSGNNTYRDNGTYQNLIPDINQGIFQTFSNSGSANTISNIPALNNTNPHDFLITSIFLGGNAGSGGTVPSPSPWTNLVFNPPTVANTRLSDAFYSSTIIPPGAYDPSWSWSTSTTWVQLSTALLPQFAVLQRGYFSGGTDESFTTFSFNNPNQAGNAFVVIAFVASADPSTFDINDNSGNTYTTLTSNYNSSEGFSFIAWIAYDISGGGPTEITVNNNNQVTNIHVYEIGGLPTSNALDASTYQYQSSSTTLSSGSVTTTNPNDLLIGASCQNATTGTYTVGTDYFNIQTNNGSSLTSSSEEQFTTSAGSNSATFSLSPNSTNTLTVLLALSSAQIEPSVSTSLLTLWGVG